jgi:hypothetical protein
MVGSCSKYINYVQYKSKHPFGAEIRVAEIRQALEIWAIISTLLCALKWFLTS